MTSPDIFTNVHKGIRRALFEVCIGLGRAPDEPRQSVGVRAQLREVLHFVAHHGENEDLLLVPLLEARAPAVAERMLAEHRRIDPVVAALIARIDTAPTSELYVQTSEFVALYLEHMHEEETQLQPVIREVLSVEELSGFGQGSVERTAPADQRMMLRWMLPAMTQPDVDAFLARLPAALADELREMIGPMS